MPVKRKVNNFVGNRNGRPDGSGDGHCFRGKAANDGAIAAIENHAWPGNVRELVNAVKRATIMADSGRVTADDLALAGADEVEGGSGGQPESLDLRAAREAAERQVVLAALGRGNGNLVKVAEMLGVSRPTLYDLMNRLAIKHNASFEK